MRHLGLDDELLKDYVRPEAYVFRLHDTGEELQRSALSADHERKHQAPYVQLHRQRRKWPPAGLLGGFAPGAISEQWRSSDAVSLPSSLAL
jgi:hypothetical protein